MSHYTFTCNIVMSKKVRLNSYGTWQKETNSFLYAFFDSQKRGKVFSLSVSFLCHSRWVMIWLTRTSYAYSTRSQFFWLRLDEQTNGPRLQIHNIWLNDGVSLHPSWCCHLYLSAFLCWQFGSITVSKTKYRLIWFWTIDPILTFAELPKPFVEL